MPILINSIKLINSIMFACVVLLFLLVGFPLLFHIPT